MAAAAAAEEEVGRIGRSAHCATARRLTRCAATEERAGGASVGIATLAAVSLCGRGGGQERRIQRRRAGQSKDGRQRLRSTRAR